MAKLYVFTLDFTFKRQKALSTLAFLHKLSPPTTTAQIYSQSDALGCTQYFESRKPLLFSEHIEIHSFSRIFLTKEQVEFAAHYGCHDIKRFYSLVNDINASEKIHFLCRVIIHGSLKSDHGFQMEEYSDNNPNKRAYVSPETISQIISTSIPHEWKTSFTYENPLNIQLVSCSAGGTKNYFNLDSDSLASHLIKSLADKNLISSIQASTTSINYRADYWQFEMRAEPLVIQIKNTNMAFDALFHELYYRRGFENALNHVLMHLASIHDIESMKSLDDYLSEHCKKHIYLDTGRIIQTKKIGNKLSYCLDLKKQICVKDYSTGKMFIDKNDFLFESHRDTLLAYLWIEYIYNQLAAINPNYAKYKVSASNNDILFFIDKIECSQNRQEFLQILNQCERTLSKNLQHVHPHKSRIDKILNYIFHRKSQLMHCEIQDTNLHKWKENFYVPNRTTENFFKHQI